jgi:tryptophan-rich hypothetical protein
LVTELFCDDEGCVQQLELQALLTKRSERLDWQVLLDEQRWIIGWR